MNISGMIKGATLVCSKHKSAILAGVSIVGTVTTAVLCVRQTIKAKKIVDEYEEDLKAVAIENTHGEVEIKEGDCKAKKSEVVKLTWKLYILPTATLAMSIACVVFAHRVDAKRIAAATAALALSETAYKELEDKTLAEIGKEKFDEIKHKINQDKTELASGRVRNVVCPAGEEMLLFCENVTNHPFWSTWRDVERGVNELNRDALEGCGIVTLNDIFYKFNVDPIDIGDHLGWKVDGNMLMYTYDSCLTPDGRSCIVLEFNKPCLI